MSGTIRFEVCDASGLPLRAAAEIADALRVARDLRGRCSLALSGGSTPGPTFERLAAADIGWANVDVFQVDERVAPAGAPDRNLTLISERLCAHIEGERPRVYPMDVTAQNVSDAADAYAELLASITGQPPMIDVVHLGLGPDGHTASLVPDDPVLDVHDRWVAVTRPYRGHVRMTLTYPVLNRARLVVLVVEGPGKIDALRRTLERDVSIPAGRLSPDHLIVLADEANAVSASR